MSLVERCGRECQSLRWLAIRILKSGQSLCQSGLHNLGIVLLILTLFMCWIAAATPCPWLAKVDGELYPAKYLFTVDYAENEIADDPAQHKQSHVMELLDAGSWTGNIIALPNNRVRVTHPAWFETGEGAPDFRPSQYIHYSKSDLDYTLDTQQIFNNLYAEDEEPPKKGKK